MTLDDEVRRSLRQLADEGRPVNLGRAALAGARRRRRTHLGVAAVAAGAALAIAVPVGVTGGLGRDAAPPAGRPPNPALAGQVVVTSYLDGEHTYTLDVETGEYVQGASSLAPNLRRATLHSAENFVAVTPVVDEGRKVITWPQPAGGAQWAPDSTRLASIVRAGEPPRPADLPDGRRAAAASGSEAAFSQTLFRQAQIVDVESEAGWEVPLELTGSRWGADLFWLDEQHLAVSTTDPTTAVEVPPRYPVENDDGSVSEEAGVVVPVIDEIRVYATDGTLTQRLPIDQSDYKASQDPALLWQAGGLVSDGMVVLHRQPTETTVELAAVDPAGARDTLTATLTLPEPPEEHFWKDVGLPTGRSVLPGSDVLVQADLRVEPTSPLAEDAELLAATEGYVVDLATGRARTANVPPPLDGTHWWSFGDAAWLSPEAAHLAFTP